MIAGKETKEHLLEVLGMLKATIPNDQQVKAYLNTLGKFWVGGIHFQNREEMGKRK